MFKIRLKQPFIDAVEKAQILFDPEMTRTEICKKALRWFSDNIQSVPEIEGIGIGNPQTFLIDTDYDGNTVMNITVLYIEVKINEFDGVKSSKPKLDESETEYTIAGE